MSRPVDKKEKNIFIGLCVGSIVSFLLCGYSLIYCFAMERADTLGSYILGVAYLFLHLIFCSIIFYVSFRATKLGSFFVKNLVYDAKGNVIKSKKILFIILSVIFFAVFVYSFIQGITMSLPLANVMAKVVWHAIMNAMFMATIIFMVFIIYPIVPYYSDNKHAM